MYRQEKECDSTPAQKVLRTALENKPERFMNMLNNAEESYAKNLRKGLGGDSAPKVDMGTERALALIKKLLADFEEEERRLGYSPKIVEGGAGGENLSVEGRGVGPIGNS